MPALPRDSLLYSRRGREVAPHYFLESDHPWLRALLDEYERFEGRTRRELAERLADPLPVRAPFDKVRIARHVLDRTWRYRTAAVVSPRRVRATLFRAAARHRGREQAIAAATAELGIDEPALLASLFADRPAEQVLARPPGGMSPSTLGQRANLALVAGLLARAGQVRIRAAGQVRPLVRRAKNVGLLCTVHPRHGREAEGLDISGPLALFRRTRLYGRALASLIPLAAWCQDMELRASLLLDDHGEPSELVVRSGDPLFPAPEPSRWDSRLEERFARDFARLAPAWEVVREPEAVPVEGTLVFPDFELRHRRDPGRRWLLEIVGFWTPEYLQTKLRRLRAADLDRFILCIDEERNCSADDLPSRARVLRYRRRVDAAVVLALIELGS